MPSCSGLIYDSYGSCIGLVTLLTQNHRFGPSSSAAHKSAEHQQLSLEVISSVCKGFDEAAVSAVTLTLTLIRGVIHFTIGNIENFPV